MEDKIKLFIKYMEKERELAIQWDKEDGIDVESPDYHPELICVSRVKSFIAYRNIRIEEAWYAKFNKGDNSREVREKLYDYDKERSRRHSHALTSMIGLNRFGEKYGLPKFYDGELLESSDIENYKRIDVRKKETDFFLQFIDALNRMPSLKLKKYFQEMGIKENEDKEKDFLNYLQTSVKDIQNIDRAYGVKNSLLEDDGNITFKDDNKFDKYR